MRRCFLLVAMVMASGCVHAARVYEFNVPATPEAVDIVSRALAGEGYPPLSVDRQSGILVARWESTSQVCNNLSAMQPCSVVRRYTVVAHRARRE